MTHERRCVPFELKAVASDDAVPMSFEGYGSVFNTVDSYNDTIAKGAFRSTLKEWRGQGRLPKLLLQHGGGGFFSQNADDLVPIGKWDEMREDDHGLYVRGHLFDVDTDRTKSTYAAMQAGELDGLSIGFRTRKSKMDDESGIRTLTDVQLFEVSLVTFPANDPARVTEVRSSELPDAVEFERWLRRDAGLSRAEARRVVATCYKRLLRNAADMDEDPADIAPRHVGGNREHVIEVVEAIRRVYAGVPLHGTRSQRADRSDRA